MDSFYFYFFVLAAFSYRNPRDSSRKGRKSLMRTRLRRFALLCFTLSLFVATAGQSIAFDELEETRSLLQQGLMIHELDREIAGLSVKEVQITMQSWRIRNG